MNINIDGIKEQVRDVLNGNNNVIREDDVVIFTSWDEEIVTGLIRKEHQRQENIHNQVAYLELAERNHLRWERIADTLRQVQGRDYQYELLKEIVFEKWCENGVKTEELIKLLGDYKQL